jgi:DNA-binding transcriptional MerR regulator
MRLKKTYSSREVAALTGLSARQLQLWHAGRLLSPTVPSHRTEAGGYTERRYTPIELFELLVLADLRRRGFSVHQLHEVVRVLRERFGQRLFDATGGGGSLQLLTDGREIYGRTSGGAFFNLLKDPEQPLLVVGDETALKELSGKLRGKRRKSPKDSVAQGFSPAKKRVSESEKSSRDRRPAAE